MSSNTSPENLEHPSVPEDNQQLAEALRRFVTLKELRESELFERHQAEVRRLLDTPRVYHAPDVSPRLKSFLRVAEWNIERGAQLDGIVDTLNSHPVLRYADLLLLNELDNGMARSGNVDVAHRLSTELSAHAVFAAEYLELSKSAACERLLTGENTAALHGNAILSRYPISYPEVVRLPRCENNFESAEPRIGGRIALIADVALPGRTILAATTHLDVVNSPRCRGRQMRAALLAIEARIRRLTPGPQATMPAVVGGDLNTHTFWRGGRLNAMRNTILILGRNPDKLAARLMQPERKEAAVREFRRFGYEIDATNDGSTTSRSTVSNLEDASRLVWPLDWWVKRRVGPKGLRLDFRLDWLGQRGLRVLEDREVTDAQAGITSAAARTISVLSREGTALSDHDPIVADLAFI